MAVVKIDHGLQPIGAWQRQKHIDVIHGRV